MALAAPVEVGTMLMRGGAGTAEVVVRAVLQVLVGRVGVDGGHEAALDAELVVEDLGQRAPGSWWCTTRWR